MKITSKKLYKELAEAIKNTYETKFTDKNVLKCLLISYIEEIFGGEKDFIPVDFNEMCGVK